MTSLVWKLIDPERSMVKGGKKAGTRRLRASCDRCHHAKTRCIYEEDHQDCIRCTNRSFTCQRSLSMPRKRTTPKPQQPPQIEPYPTPPEQFQTPQSSTSTAYDALTPRTSVTDASTLAGSPDQRLPSEVPMFDFSHFADFESSPFSPVVDVGGFFGPAATLHPDTPIQEPPAHVLAPAPTLQTTAPARARGATAATDGLHHHHLTNNSNKHSCSPSPFSPPSTSSSCLDLLNRTLRDLQASPVEGKTLDHVLRLNRALLGVVSAVIECGSSSSSSPSCSSPQHHPAVDFTVYFCLVKLVSTYHEALFMPCNERSSTTAVQFGSYVVDVEDQLALKCRIVLIDVGKIAALLDRLQARAVARVVQREEEEELGRGQSGGGVGRTMTTGSSNSRCRRQCQFLHRFAKNEVERVTKHIRLLGG